MTQWPDRKWLCDDVIEAVQNTLQYYQKNGQDLPSQGFFEEKYCQEFSDYQGGGYTDAVNSGTSAVYVALSALDAKPGPLILSSPVTDFGTISAILLKGIKILIPDSKSNSFNTNLKKIEHLNLENVTGMILTHSAGEPIEDIEKIANFCSDNSMWLIEDCSQAHGASVGNKKVGTFGDIAIFSTMHSKMHSTGGSGGLIYTRSKELFHRIRSFSDRGKRFELEGFNSKDPEHILAPSLNFNSDEVSCSIGSINLRKVDSVIKNRVKFLEKLQNKIKEHHLPFRISMKIDSASPYFCPIAIDLAPKQIGLIKNFLVKSNFPCNPRYSFIVSEWNWAKDHIHPLSSNGQNVRNFRDSSFNLLFNERFGDLELNALIEILKNARESIG